MDPLSVSASVVGLLAAGVAATNALSKFIRDGRDAPKVIQHLLQEITDTTAALNSLQAYLNRRLRTPKRCEALILLEHVLTTLTGCVTTYSDLQLLVDELDLETHGIFDKLTWSRKESQISVLLLRLQNNKSSLSLMLNILQW
jgi:hypothetical protein